jgi:hypothetical protein
MTALRQSYAVPALAALCLFALTTSAWASTGPKWSAAQLADFADVIVTGRVDAATSGWDPAVQSIYTYVTIEVDEVFKGAVGDRIVVKQLGGTVGAVGLVVADQPTFAIGEQVLLYLEARPRDGSLYTSALWQGKWNIASGAFGERIAVRTDPAHAQAGVTDRIDLSSAQASARAARRSGARISVAPADAAMGVNARPFAFLGPYRWTTVPAVDVQSGGQPGLSGGGGAQIATAISVWNAAGTGTRLAGGSSAVARKCTSELTGTGRITISFNDPCGEISDSGGTLAIGGAAFFSGQGGTSSGVTFGRAVEGFVINNNSSVATNLLVQPGCFQDIQLHELGHVLGLDHTNDTNAIMFPSINNSCSSGAHGLGSDDRAGLAAIYGGSTTPGVTPPSTAPANVTVTVNGTTSLTVSWNAVTALVAGAPSAATSYRIDFRATPTGAVLVSASSASTTLPVAIPAGVLGTFYVSVTGLNSAGAGPSSTPVAFTIGSGTPGPGPCTSAPGPVSGVTGGVSGGIARVQWAASAGATEYLVQAGSTQGTANLFPLTNIGNNLGAQAPVPAGFTAWVRIFARNACGTSTGVDFFLQ